VKPAIIDIVIDESRNILYTLSARGAIEVMRSESDRPGSTAHSLTQLFIYLFNGTG
jgi:hypothetical protein